MRNSPALRSRDLESRIARLAEERGTTPARLRRLVGFAVLCETLAEALARGVIPLFFVKGGVAIELRLGLAARATKDVDLGLCAPPAELLPVFDRALEVGFADFTLRRRGEARVLDNGVRQIEVTVQYLGRPWATIEVDLAPASADAATDAVPPFALHDLGLTAPRPVPCLALAEQIAQKIHALTEPAPRGRVNARARDVIDVLLLDARGGIDYAAVQYACERVFAARAVHSWPILRFVFPGEWSPTLTALAKQNSYNADVLTIETRFNTFLARLHGAPVMPGYEYQFVALLSHRGTVLEGAVKTSGMAYDHFVALTASGWRVCSMTARPGYADQILVLLEREITAEA